VVQNFLAYLLEGATGAAMARDLPQGLNGVRATAANGDGVLVVWARTATDVQELAVPAGATVYDQWGNEQEVETLTVTTDPWYVVTKAP